MMSSLLYSALSSVLQTLPFPALQAYWRIVGGRRRFPERYYRIRNELESIEFESAETIQRISLRKAIDMVRYAGTHSAYYGDLFRRHDVSPDEIRTIEDFRRIPFLTKKDVQENLEALCSQDPGLSRPNRLTTGGSTGIPLAFFVDREQSMSERAFHHHYWGKILGYSPGDRIVRLRGEAFVGKRLRRYSMDDNALALSSYHLTEENVRRYLRWIAAYHPRFLHVYPSSMYQMAKVMRENGLEMPPGDLRAVLCGSENIYGFQRKLIEEVARTRAFSWYGHAEGAVLAVECESTSEYHFIPTYGFVEFIDSSGRPATTDGAMVEIVGTGFLNHATPFIRYRTMDYGVLSTTPCACGRSFPRLKRIEGRLQEMIITETGRLISMTAVNMHDDTFDNVRQFQFRQAERGRVELNIVREAGFTKTDAARILKEVGKKLGDDMLLELRYVDEIPRTRSGKFRFLIQELPDVAAFAPDEESEA